MNTYLKSLYGTQQNPHHKTVVESSYGQAMGVFANVVMEWSKRWLQQRGPPLPPSLLCQELCLQVEQTKTLLTTDMLTYVGRFVSNGHHNMALYWNDDTLHIRFASVSSRAR